MNEENKHYELYLIIDSKIDKSTYESIVSKFLSYLKNQKAEIDHVINYGLKHLAYNIKGHSTGFCDVVQFRSAPNVIKPLDTELMRNERVLRFLITKLNKHGIEYNKKKNTQSLNKSIDSPSNSPLKPSA